MTNENINEINGVTFDLLGDNDLERMGRGIFMLIPIITNPDPKWWKETGRYEVARQLQKIGNSWVRLSKTHEIRPKSEEPVRTTMKNVVLGVSEHYHILEYTADNNALRDPDDARFYGQVYLDCVTDFLERIEENKWSYSNRYGGKTITYKLSGWDGGFCDDRCLKLAEEEVGSV